ncbi:hypothetical protein FOZ62_010878, partial [Perkinsus olseni]
RRTYAIGIVEWPLCSFKMPMAHSSAALAWRGSQGSRSGRVTCDATERILLSSSPTLHEICGSCGYGIVRKQGSIPWQPLACFLTTICQTWLPLRGLGRRVENCE